MIQFSRFILDNGLTLLVHEDHSTPLAFSCLTYNVGTKNEQRNKTGFAHLFEHLMFGGSKHAPNFDQQMQLAGGENNAFTNQDMTVYYNMFPAQNLEHIIWLEADRMSNLNLNQHNLDRERKIVVEEFKESCLNEPYGDIWHHIGELAYTKHPYQIPTIGKDFQHIENASLKDVEAFFNNFYCPENAVLCISGHVNAQEVYLLTQKWFGDIDPGHKNPNIHPKEPRQENARYKRVEADVALNALYLVFPSAARLEDNYYLDDMITDILAEGEASPLYQELVKNQALFSEIDAYLTGNIEQGLLVIEGKLSQSISFQQAEDAIWTELEKLSTNLLPAKALKKLLNRIEHNLEFGTTSSLHKAINLAFYETISEAEMINKEKDKYLTIKAQDLKKRAQLVFQRQKCSTLHYCSTQIENN